MPSRFTPQRPTKRYLAAHAALYTGDTDNLTPPRAKPVQYEAAHQAALTKAIRTQWWGPYFSHWPNERPQRLEAWRLSGQGVRKGMPDNWLFLRRGPHAAAVAELKAPETRGRPSKEQLWWLATLEAIGFHTGWHRGWEVQLEFFKAYAGQRQEGDPAPPRAAIDDDIPGQV